MQGAQVRSLVGELTSLMPSSTAKKKNNKKTTCHEVHVAHASTSELWGEDIEMFPNLLDWSEFWVIPFHEVVDTAV